MKKLATVTSAGILSVAVAGSIVSPAFAWHPKGTITKSVQDITSGSSLEAADTADAAVNAKPGDILEYVVEVKNVADPASDHYNDMAYTVVTDTLPDGVSLISDPAKRNLSDDLGTLVPGQSKTVKYQVKVTASTDTTITNKACFTADSTVKDNPQQGCDIAVVKVTVPAPAPAPAPTPAPTPTPPAPAQPATLPNTGTGSSVLFAGLFGGIVGYGAYLLRLKRKTA